MSPVVLKPDKKTYQKILAHYQKFRLDKPVQYAEFAAKKGNTTITIYTSGKVMFQGPQAQAEASQWGDLPAASEKFAAKKSGLPQNFAQLSVVGSDEVGNGSYFGPLVVCAAYAPANKLAHLKKIGVKDSKALTDKQIQRIAEKLKTELQYQLLILEPETYNKIQPKYNAVHMKVVLHNQVIFSLLKKIAPEKPDAILIDQFTPEANFRKYVSGEKNQVTEKIYFTTKGEQHHLSVAAASILCRAAFVDELAKAAHALDIPVSSGAGANADNAAAKVLAKGGMELLAKHVKLHFANTQKAENLAKKMF